MKLTVTSFRLLWSFPGLFEGNRAILDMEARIGEFYELLVSREIYTQTCKGSKNSSIKAKPREA